MRDQKATVLTSKNGSDGAKRGTILIVEDSPVQSELLRRTLVAAGYAVLIAPDGAQGLALAEAHRPDAVVSDINMPLMDGYQMCDAIRKNDALKSMPVILVTMLSDPKDVIAGLRSGADAYLTKPYNAASLISRIESLLASPVTPYRGLDRRKMEVLLDGERYSVQVNNQRMLNLLVSTYENAVLQNRELAATQQALEELNAQLESKVLEKTAALQESEEKFRAITVCAPDAIVVADPEGKIAFWNTAAEKIFGYAADEVQGTFVRDVIVPERLREAHQRGLERFQASGEGMHVGRMREVEALRKGGKEFTAEVSLSGFTVNGRHHAAAIIRDITERKQNEKRISRLNRLYAVLSRVNTTIVRTQDRQELFESVCRIAVEEGRFRTAWLALLESNETDFRLVAKAGFDGGRLDNIVLTARDDVPDRCTLVARALREKTAVVCNDIDTDPQIALWREEALRCGYRSVVAFPLQVEGKAVGLLLLYAAETNFFDAEEMKLLTEVAGDISFALHQLEKEARLNYLAYYDVLTGLPNRALLHDRLSQRVNAAQRDHKVFGVISLSLERFKIVNETLGQHAGDELLRQVARRLQDALDESDILAYRGANSFVVVTRYTDENVVVAHVLNHTLVRIHGHPFQIEGNELHVAAKAGVAMFPADGGNADALLQNADAALEKAKRSDDGYLFYAAEFNARVAEKLTLENKLRHALERDEMVLHYQPKINLKTRHITGLEALMRWNDPDTGLVPPVKFIPVLEETGLIIGAGRWALRQALADCARWRNAGLQVPRVAVNVSAIQLRQKDFVAAVQSALNGAGKSVLDLEITESLIMHDIEANIEKLKVVRDMGVEIAVDDFGTGYSSLSYIARLPISSLKIDRAFIINMTSNPDDLSIVSAIISLGHSLSLKIVAEGVETEEQENLLRLLKCDEYQGYLFSRPVSAERMQELLNEDNSRSGQKT